MRRARVEDAPAVADIHVRAWQVAYEHVFGADRLAEITVEQRLPRWEQILAEDEQICFVAEEDERVLAWCTLAAAREQEDANTGEIWGIYAAPEAWGSGAGAALMAAAVEALRGRGYEAATLWVLEDNPRARRFYEREGWTFDGARKQDEFLGVTVDEVRYRRAL